MAPVIPDSKFIADSFADPSAFAHIFDRHFSEIFRFAARRLGSSEAEDIAADTFLIAFQRRTDFDLAMTDARPWLYGIAVHLLRNKKRKEVRGYRAFARTGVEFTDDFSAESDDRVVALASQRDLAAGLAELKAGDRDALLLHAWAGLPHEAIAKALGIPVGTVKSRLARARRVLCRRLSDEPFAALDAARPKEA